MAKAGKEAVARGRPHTTEYTLTRRELAGELAKILGTNVAGAKVVSAYFAQVQSALAAGETVTIHNFGRFATSNKRERLGRNPRTGEASMITPRRVVSFKPSTKLRARIKAHIENA